MYSASGVVGKASKEFNFGLLRTVQHFTMLFSSYFGKSFSGIRGGDRLRTLLFGYSLVGTVIWISYRASLTSNLAIREPALPFITLEGLLVSDYEYATYFIDVLSY